MYTATERQAGIYMVLSHGLNTYYGTLTRDPEHPEYYRFYVSANARNYFTIEPHHLAPELRAYAERVFTAYSAEPEPDPADVALDAFTAALAALAQFEQWQRGTRTLPNDYCQRKAALEAGVKEARATLRKLCGVE